eukprot:2520536-Pyramimonas_sp.AAC.1
MGGRDQQHQAGQHRGTDHAWAVQHTRPPSSDVQGTQAHEAEQIHGAPPPTALERQLQKELQARPALGQ